MSTKSISARTGAAFLLACAVLIVCKGTGLAEESGEKGLAERSLRERHYQPGEGYEREPEYAFEGVIKQLPADTTLGIWTIDDRQIMVFPGTRVNEARGKLAVGAKVAVKGILKDLNFMASEIEVKGSADKP